MPSFAMWSGLLYFVFHLTLVAVCVAGILLWRKARLKSALVVSAGAAIIVLTRVFAENLAWYTLYQADKRLLDVVFGSTLVLGSIGHALLAIGIFLVLRSVTRKSGT